MLATLSHDCDIKHTCIIIKKIMAGRKRKGPAAPEKITKYLQQMRDPGNDNPEMECDDPAPETQREAPARGSRTNLDSHDCGDGLNQSQAECHSESECSGGNVMDLGCIITPMTTKEVCDTIDRMDNRQKYKLLMEHFKPEVSFSFPKTFNSGCNQSFQYRWLEKYPWSLYSKHLDGGFYKFCALFAKNREKLGVLVNKPFVNWVKVNNICEGHSTNAYHICAVEAGLDFQRSIEQQQLNIDVRMNTELFNRIQDNCHIISCCTECILYCGRQCIALRGDIERLNQPGNPGNFLATVYVNCHG